MDQTIPQGGWWSRNWKWFVPVGCLSLLATCGCCIGGSLLFTVNAIKGSHAYQEAVAKAKADPDVQAALGTPVEAGWMVQFNTNLHDGVTETHARIPLQGPKGEGALHVVAREKGKDLTFEQLDVVIGNKVLHLPGAEPDTHPTSPDGANDQEGDPGDVDVDEPDDPDDDGAEGHQPDMTVEGATNRPGGDYRDYEVADGDPSKCALDCAGDEKCQAYTFVKPAHGKSARCRLKDRAPAKAASDCCVSGVKK